MRTGMATLTAPVAPAVAFAFLADPHNAPEWFAPVAYAPSVAPAAPAPPAPAIASLRVGATWRFISNAPTNAGRAAARRVAEIPLRMVAYEPPTHFAWATTYPKMRDNLRWEVTCVPSAPEPPVSSPPPTVATPDGAPPLTPSPIQTTIHLTIRIEPGPLGWVSLLVAAPFMRGGLDRRAQRALDRACETLVARAELADRRQAPPPGSRATHDADRRNETRRKRR